MVSWRNQTRNLETNNYFEEGRLTGWSKGDRAFFVLNSDNDPRTKTLQTGLKPGSYCNLLSPDSCESSPLVVNQEGLLEITISGYSAVAILAD